MARVLVTLADQPVRALLKPVKEPKEKRKGGLQRSKPMQSKPAKGKSASAAPKRQNANKKPMNPLKKVSHNRRTEKRAKRGEFSPKTRQWIKERDGELCVRCKRRFEHIHHVIFKSQGGLGAVDNGVCVCQPCHEWAHGCREGREWFEEYRVVNLLPVAAS